MYLVFPFIVTIILLLQCLSCSFGQSQKVNIADMHYDYDIEIDQKQDTKSVLKSFDYPMTKIYLVRILKYPSS